jgi:hypothetical protein
MITKYFAWIVFIIVAANVECAEAKVMDAAAGGFTIKHSFEVNKGAAEAYTLFASKIAAWWDSDHTYSGKSENLSLELRPNGCFCESLENQGSIVHMTVIYAQPGKILRMSGGLGPLQQFGAAGAMTIEFAGEANRTTVTLTYSVGGYAPGGFEKLAPLVDQVMVGQMGRYERFVNTGKP